MKKLVKFSNGKYGVRTGCWITGYKFIDLATPRFKWSFDDRYFHDCQGDIETATHRLKAKLTYEIVNDK